MMSTDVGAAPAASTIHDGAPFAGASRREAGESPDDFATMFDRCAGAGTPGTSDAGPTRTVPKGVGPQAEQATSTIVASAISRSVPAASDAAPDVADDDTEAGVEATDEAETSHDPGAQAFDARFFVPFVLTVPPTVASAADTAPPATPAGAAEPVPGGNAHVMAQSMLPVLPAHARGPLAAFTAVTPRPMGPTVGTGQGLPVDEPGEDPTVPLESSAVASEGFDDADVVLSTTQVGLTPEERAAVQDAVDRLAAGATSTTSQVPVEAADEQNNPSASTLVGQFGDDGRRIAIASVRSALAASATSSSPTVMTTVPPDGPVSIEPSPIAAEDVAPQGLAQAVAAAPQHAMTGLHRAVSHASKPIDAPPALHVDETVSAAVSPDATVSDGSAPMYDDSAAVSGDPAVSDSRTQQAAVHAEVAPRPAAPAETPGPSAAAPVRGHAARAAVQDAPAATPRPSARVAHAIAAFQAAAHAAGTPPIAAPAVFSAAVPTALLDQELPTQIVQAIRVQFDNGSGEARMRLNPGFLGGMTVGVEVDGTSVVASLQASNAEVRDWLQRNEQVLRQALADQGLHLDRLVIVEDEARAGANDEGGNQSSQQQERQPQRRPRRPSDESTFEVEL